uniref:Uncharacterized protein n=1 Tax=Hordeum vulgare subsp. vulgare TaxID=112509 RepID=A0A8I6YHI8_HORVV
MCAPHSLISSLINSQKRKRPCPAEFRALAAVGMEPRRASPAASWTGDERGRSRRAAEGRRDGQRRRSLPRWAAGASLGSVPA